MAKQWYIVHVYSAMEKSIAKSLQERIDRSEYAHMFGEILVPTEEILEVRNGQKTTSERRLFPGYVFVEIELTDETWHLVKSTPKVTGFIGGKANKPTPISAAEVQSMRDQMKAGADKPRPKILFEIGEVVRIKEGPFADFNGNVEEVIYDKNRLRVSVTIFGRATSVDMDFSQVEKV
jgi:transcription termination/antitermination protein NusG